MPEEGAVSVLAIDPDPVVLHFMRRIALSSGYGFTGAKRADDEAAAHIGLYHRKANLSARHPAAAFTVTFSETQTEITPTSIAVISALAEYAPLWQRMKDALTRGPLTLVDLAKELDAKVETLDRTVRRKSGLFTRVSAFKDGITRIALVERRAS